MFEEWRGSPSLQKQLSSCSQSTPARLNHRWLMAHRGAIQIVTQGFPHRILIFNRNQLSTSGRENRSSPYDMTRPRLSSGCGWFSRTELHPMNQQLLPERLLFFKEALRGKVSGKGTSNPIDHSIILIIEANPASCCIRISKGFVLRARQRYEWED